MPLSYDDSETFRLWIQDLGIRPQGERLDGFRLFPRPATGSHIYDILTVGDITVAALNSSLHASFSEAHEGKTPTLDILLKWLEGTISPLAIPDCIRYLDGRRFDEDAAARIAAETGLAVRIIDDADRDAFRDFEKSCPKADLKASGVKLSHEIAAGAFSTDGKLVSAASATFMPDSEDDADRRLDIARLAKPEWRGKRADLACVAGLCSAILKEGLLPQIRTRRGTDEGTDLADALGFVKWGEWLYPDASED